MDPCKLCKKNDATQTNSHLLTWALLKQAVNIDGHKERGFDFHFALSNLNTSKYYVGQSVLPEKVDNFFGPSKPGENDLQPIDPFIRDYILCPSCESAIGKIESEFISRVYNRLERIDTKPLPLDNKGNPIYNVKAYDTKLTALFTYSLFFRMSLGEFNNYSLDPQMQEKIRMVLLSNLAKTQAELKSCIENLTIDSLPFPIIVFYLQTPNSNENLVTQNRSNTPYFIWANKLTFQLYKKKNHIKSSIEHLYGFSELIDPNEYFNKDFSTFAITIISDEKRGKVILNTWEQIESARISFVTRLFYYMCKSKSIKTVTQTDKERFLDNYRYFRSQDINANPQSFFFKAFATTFGLKIQSE
jgi:hypothetical protein